MLALLLVDVPEIEVEIGNDGRSTIVLGDGTFDNCGADLRISNAKSTLLIKTNQSILFPEPAIIHGVTISFGRAGRIEGTYVFRKPTEANQLTSIP